jgi:alginate O-acetyltransferase complex protein AlgJ
LRFLALKLSRIKQARAFGRGIQGKRGFDLRGWVELRSPTCVYGWVWDASNPSQRIHVVAKSAEGEIAAAVADDYRSDLQAAAIGDGRYGFTLEFTSTDPDLVCVEVAGLDIAIPNVDSNLTVAAEAQEREFGSEIGEGRDGWLFLRLGTNRVIRFFTEPGYFSTTDVERWCDLLAARTKRVSELGARYVHFIVPDKLTVYRDYYLGPLSCYDLRPSRAIPLALRRRGLSHVYVDVTLQLIAERHTRLLFYKTDTHWTPFGAFIAYQLLCKALGVEELSFSELVCREYVSTFDLGGKLDPQVQETGFHFNVPNSGALIFANELSTYFDDQHIYHNQRGRQYVYRNDRLSGAKKLVLFGDSFSAAFSFLPLLSRTFYEVHFFWSASVDFRYLEEVKPDFVVTEIAERFVKVLPDDQLDIREFARQRYAALVKSRSSKTPA